MNINKSGVWGEVYTVRFLREHGFQIVTANFRSRLGEIDIIAEKGKYLCCVEVKTRNQSAIAAPKEAVDINKQKRLIATSQIFLKIYKTRKQPRFDVCEVILDDDFKLVNINYIENAFST